MQIKLFTHPSDEKYIPSEEMREEQRRQAHKEYLQRTRELQRIVGPCLAPGIDGVFWQRMRPTETDGTGDPKTPILSILECTLKLDVDIRDGSKPPRQLWDAVVTYISSLPGCNTVEWGLGLDGGDNAFPTSLYCLVHWDSVLAWWTFQYSPSFSPLFGFLASDPSNRCAKLGVSGVPRLNGTQNEAVMVDIITVSFNADDVPSPKSRTSFGEDWKSLVDSASSGRNDGLRQSYAVWLENNVVTLPEPTPSEAAVANKFATFTAFLAWNRESYDSRRVADICDSLRALPLFCASGPTISRRTVRFINEIQRESRTSLQQLVTPYSLASILQTDFPRQCSPNIPRLVNHYTGVLRRSMDDVSARMRLFPAPRGIYLLKFQGSLFEGCKTLLPRFHSEEQLADPHHFLDVIWMQLTYRTRRSEAFRIYEQLNDETSVLPGCVKTYWALDPDHKKQFSVLTVWEGRDAREACLHQYYRILDSFAASSAQVAVPLTHHGFPIDRGNPLTGPWLNKVPHLEITRFHVSPGLTARQLFEHAYFIFGRITVPTEQAGGPSPACYLEREAAWQQPIEEINSDSDFQIYTGVITWESPEARTEWYEQLFNFSRESYEMFGQTLDSLKILAAGGVESWFLALQS